MNLQPSDDIVVLPAVEPEPAPEPVGETRLAATLDQAAAAAAERAWELLEPRATAVPPPRWRVRRLPGAVERSSGMRGDLRVQASYAEDTGALLLEVSSRPLLVGRGRARQLVWR